MLTHVKRIRFIPRFGGVFVCFILIYVRTYTLHIYIFTTTIPLYVVNAEPKLSSPFANILWSHQQTNRRKGLIPYAIRIEIDRIQWVMSLFAVYIVLHHHRCHATHRRQPFNLVKYLRNKSFAFATEYARAFLCINERETHYCVSNMNVGDINVCPSALSRHHIWMRPE